MIPRVAEIGWFSKIGISSTTNWFCCQKYIHIMESPGSIVSMQFIYRTWWHFQPLGELLISFTIYEYFDWNSTRKKTQWTVNSIVIRFFPCTIAFYSSLVNNNLKLHMFLILLYYDWSFYNRLWIICYNDVVMLFAFFVRFGERAVISNGEFSLYFVASTLLNTCCCSYWNAFLVIIADNICSQIVLLFKW